MVRDRVATYAGLAFLSAAGFWPLGLYTAPPQALLAASITFAVLTLSRVCRGGGDAGVGAALSSLGDGWQCGVARRGRRRRRDRHPRVQSRRNGRAAIRFFRKLRKGVVNLTCS